MSTAIPTMTSMVAPQAASSYLTAPAMTSMYAPASMYTPATTARAVAAPVTTAAPSYVAAPVAVAAPVSNFATPMPQSLTQGLPTPDKVQQEASAYHKAIDGQLAKQAAAVQEEAKIKKAMLTQQATTQIEQYKLQIEEELAIANLKTDQQALQQVTGLKEAAILQQTGCEEKAAVMTAEYNKKKAMEEMAAQSYQLQKKWYDQEMALAQQYESVRAKGSKAVATPSIAQQPVAAPMTTAAPVAYAAPATYARPATYAAAAPATYARPATYGAAIPTGTVY